MRERVLLVIALVAAGRVAVADDATGDAAALSPGCRVRVTRGPGPDSSTTGVLLGLEDDAILLRPDAGSAPYRAPLGPTTRVEVSAGRRSRARWGAALGAGIGAAPGFLLTFGDANSSGDMPSPAVVAAMGAAGGALLGAGIGWLVKAEEWREVALPHAAVAIGPDGRGGVVALVRVSWGGAR